MLNHWKKTEERFSTFFFFISFHKGCSPSPCGSLSSNTDVFRNGEILSLTNGQADEIIGGDMDKQQSNKNKARALFVRSGSMTPANKESQEYLQSFDRRYSDSNYVIRETSAMEKMNLADEIKKLSDRLLMLSSINDELTDYNQKVTSSNNNADSEKPSENAKNVKQKPEKLKNIKNSKFNKTDASIEIPKTNGNESNASNPIIPNNKTVPDKKPAKSVVNDLAERMKTLDDTPNLFKNMLNARADNLAVHDNVPVNGTKNSKRATSVSSGSSTTSSQTAPHTSVPWPITNKRTKFRVTQLSRDVPVGSPDSHQTVFLEEAANTTKDCLLHLLEKYNGKGSRPSTGIRRHQSISVGHGIADNLEYNTMNSINAFLKRNANSGNTIKQIQAQIQSKHK